MKLNLQLSCYNGARYLPFLFASLAKQTYRDWELFVLDNASDDENKKMIEQSVAASGLPIKLFRVEKNIGFVGAHNFLFEKTKDVSEAIQLLNDDAILEPEFLAKSLAHLEKHARCAAVTGTILRWDFDRRDLPDGGRTNIVDSLGLSLDWRGFVRDIDMGLSFETLRVTSYAPTVFGVSGCLPMYRVAAVKAVSMDESLFDPSFFMYKEDVELAFRLHAAGYTASITDAKAYHRRSYGTTSVKRPKNDAAYFSLRNHLWIMIMHMPWLSLFTNRIGVIPFELLKFLYWLVRKPSFSFRAIRETAAHWPELMRKRHFVPTLPQVAKPLCNIAVIVVGHEDLNEESLRSLRTAYDASSHSVEVVVVDNQSTKYRANELVGEILPRAWTLLRNGDFGYGRSMNMGAAWVDAEYYFILNPDTVLTDPLILDKMYERMRARPDIGLLAPKVFYFDGTLQETCRRYPKWYMPFVQRSFLKDTAFGRRYTASFCMQDYDHASERPVDWVQGSAMFVDGALWKRLGGFDDRFWMYFEDVDLCRRIQRVGRIVEYWPAVSIKHAHGKESAKYKNFFRNLIYNKVARAHVLSWLKYELKWRITS